MASKRVPASSASACTSEAGSTSEASPSEDQLPSSTSQFLACSSLECDRESVEATNKVRKKLIETGQMDSVEEATNKVRKKLIETGQMDRLKDLMERRLSEVGWRIDMMSKCREVVEKKGSSTSFEMLFQPIRQLGKDLVPTEIKKDVLRQIKHCYESEAKEK